MTLNELLIAVASVYGQTVDPTSATYNAVDLSRIIGAINRARDRVIADLKLVSFKTTTFTTTASTFLYTPFRDMGQILSIRHRASKTPLLPITAQHFYRLVGDTSSGASGNPRYYVDSLGPDAGCFNQIGLYPVPASADTIDIIYRIVPRPLANLNYTTGTITLAASTAVVGSSTTFTAQMVGRYLRGTNDGYWYQISGFTSTTAITLAKSFEGTTGASLAYTIAERPALNGQDDSFDMAIVTYAQYLLLLSDKNMDAIIILKSEYKDQIKSLRSYLQSNINKTNVMESEDEGVSLAEAVFGYRKLDGWL